ncbi:MAG: nucleotidyltransferase domain-containing protein [Nitrososphaerota archaeon]
MENLYGIGSKLAEKIRKELISRGEIEENKTYTEKEIRGILKKSAIFKDLPTSTQMDLKYNPSRKIPYELIYFMNKELKKIWKGIKFEIAGSFIRKKPFSSDIDIVVIGNWDDLQKRINLKSKILRALDPFEKGKYIVGTLFLIAIPPQLREIFKLKKVIAIKVDLFFTTEDEYIFARLFAVGSGKFNIIMRTLAKRNGYLLNQHGLFKNGKKVRIKNEREIFEKIGKTYREPQDRN